MMRELLNRIFHVGTLKFYDDHVYMKRYCFLNTFCINIIYKGDLEFHNHPWWYMSLVLSGAYKERNKTGSRTRKAGSLVFRRGEEFHKIEVKGDRCVTLFIKGRFQRVADVMHEGKVMPWPVYVRKVVGVPKKLINRVFNELNWRY